MVSGVVYLVLSPTSFFRMYCRKSQVSGDLNLIILKRKQHFDHWKLFSKSLLFLIMIFKIITNFYTLQFLYYGHSLKIVRIYTMDLMTQLQVP
jgi:hypothetical protein